MSDFKQIPSIDLNDFTSGNPNTKKTFVKQLGDAYENIGFVAVKNHGLSDKLCKDLYSEVQNFFNLSEEQKRTYEIKGLSGQRGYVSFGKEHAKNRNEGDLKEFWHFGQHVTDGDPIQKMYPDNIEVEELPNFNKVGLEAYNKLEDTGKQLLRAIALYLDLEEDYFEAKIHNGNSILRPIHYPPITQEPINAVRAAEHEDINLITLLMGASAEGLQVQNKAGAWISVTGPSRTNCCKRRRYATTTHKQQAKINDTPSHKPAKRKMESIPILYTILLTSKSRCITCLPGVMCKSSYAETILRHHSGRLFKPTHQRIGTCLIIKPLRASLSA
jgi:isopenicillin N synthase-like dioxygenase